MASQKGRITCVKVLVELTDLDENGKTKNRTAKEIIAYEADMPDAVMDWLKAGIGNAG